MIRNSQLFLAKRDASTMRWLAPIAAVCMFCLTGPLAGAAVFETLVLKDGQRITGEVVAEKQNALYIDLGYDLVRVPRDQITRRMKVDEAARVAVSASQ